MSTEQRRAELAANLDAVRARIAASANAAGRRPEEITLVVVTKYFPASDVEILADLGVRDVGENRHQEAAEKAAACAGLGLRWHFIGGLQSNKAAAVARYADVVESVDRVKLVAGLERGAAERGAVLDCLIQVSLDPPGTSGRSGAVGEEVELVLAALQSAEHLRPAGVMAVAPLGEAPESAFGRLAAITSRVRALEPEAAVISAGMSGDLEAAVAAGATHVRIGSAVLGPRPLIK